MAIPYKDIRRTVRFKERDNDEIRFSDYDIKLAVNEAIRYLSNFLADSNADFNEKHTLYNQDDYSEFFPSDGIELPEDFLSLVAVRAYPLSDKLFSPCLSSEVPGPFEYKVFGGRLFVGAKQFLMIYKSSIQEIKEDEENVEIPYFAKDVFATLVRRILTGAEGEIMREAQEMAVNALIPKRRYRNARIRMPYIINNGRKCWR